LKVADLKAVECDGGDTDGRDEHCGSRTHTHELAHERSQSPGRHQNFQQVERLREQTEREVGDGQVDDEDVTRSPHGGVACDHEAHQTVAGRTERDQQSEQCYQNRLPKHHQHMVLT